LSQRFLYSLNRHAIAGMVATLLAGGSQWLVVFMITVNLELCSTLLVESNLEMQEFFSWESWEVHGMCPEYCGHFVTEYSSAEGTAVSIIDYSWLWSNNYFLLVFQLVLCSSRLICLQNAYASNICDVLACDVSRPCWEDAPASYHGKEGDRCM
jgi:hypothetical protein